MKFEDAMVFLRNGDRIYRMEHPDKGSLCGTTEKVKGSFDLTIFDVLAEDWYFCDEKEDFNYLELY